jgi:VWFA-related protein
MPGGTRSVSHHSTPPAWRSKPCYNSALQVGKDISIRVLRPILRPSAVLSLCALALTSGFPIDAQQLPQTLPQTPAATIKTNVNEVLVPVVVRDSHGNAVATLGKSDFQVFDNGKLQPLIGFTEIKRPTVATSTSLDPSSADPGAAASTNPIQAAPPLHRFVIFVFDDLNLSISDLPQVQQAATKALDATLSPSDFAAVLATSGSNSGLTRDRAKLKQAIAALRTSSLYHDSGNECPNMSYYQGDLIINKNDGMALEAATQETMTCAHITVAEVATTIAQQAARRAVALGEQNYQTNFSFLRSIVSKLGPLPGQHLVILVSPGFLTPDAAAMALESELLDVAAQSNVTINALDARGLYTTNLDASQRSAGSPMAAELQNRYRRDSMLADADVMAELADGTGGTFVHNSNDLVSGLADLISAPECLYLLSFSTANMKPNGAYHSIKVKVDQPHMNIQARRGYFAAAPEKNKK